MKTQGIHVATLLSFFTFACGGSGIDGDTELETLVMTVSGMEPLAGGTHYEIWAIIDDAPVPVGKFDVDFAGTVLDLEDQPITDAEFFTNRDLTAASRFVVTIESDGDSDPIPSNTKYLAGTLDRTSASLTVSEAIGTGFEQAAGQYILATPTDGDFNKGMGPDNETSGIWFLDLTSANGPKPGLSLPELPAGWVYEGWVVVNEEVLSTGKFTKVDENDYDAPFQAVNPGGPEVPGEDFLVNAPGTLQFPLPITNGTAVISVEPAPDDSANPFTLKPLVGMIPADLADHVSYPMQQNLDNLPTLQVQLLP